MCVDVSAEHSPVVYVANVRRNAGRIPAKVWIVARDMLDSRGIVVLRGALPTLLVRAARTRLLKELAAYGSLEPDAPLEEARVAAACLQGHKPFPSLLRRLDMQQLPQVLRVLEHPKLFYAAASLLNASKVETTAYKWLRAVPPGTFTGPHMDRAYVGAGRRLTMWIPFGDVPICSGGPGALCWVPGSHTNPAVVEQYRGYQRAGDDGERSGWLAPDPGSMSLPLGCNWQSVDFQVGDVAVFGMDLLHTTVPNQSASFRISCDTRW